MPSLTSLAEELLAQAKQLDRVLEENNIPYTSFDTDTLESLPEDGQRLRKDLVDTSHAFGQLVRGAKASGLDLAFGWTDQFILRIIWRYKLASAVPLDGTATYEEISAASGLAQSHVARTIRAAGPLNIFNETEPGHVRHTATSRLLATSEGYYNMVGLMVQDVGPSSLKLNEAWEKFGDDAAEPDQSAFSLYNDGRPLFTVLSEEPERAHRFNSAIQYFAGDINANSSRIVEAFDWAKLDKPGLRLVDLGGGFGQNALVLAKHTQNLAFTVQDLSHAVERGRKELPVAFRDRIDFEEQNFLEPQKRQGDPPDAYLISRCLHNWSDEYCCRILRSLIPTLRRGSRVLIWDLIMSDKSLDKLSDKFALQQDWIMAVMYNGKDRTLEEFKQLLAKSGKRFKFEGVGQPQGCNHGMIEVSWDG